MPTRTSALSRSNAIARLKERLRAILGNSMTGPMMSGCRISIGCRQGAQPGRETTEKSLRRKSGPPPRHEWPLVTATEVIRKVRAGERDPTAAEMIDHCEKTFPDEFSPGLKEMQVLLRKLLLGKF